MDVSITLSGMAFNAVEASTTEPVSYTHLTLPTRIFV